MALLISYDLRKPGRNYSDLYEAIKSLGDWAHPLESVWIVDCGLDPTAVTARLRAQMDANDFILVIGVRRPADGFLEAEMWPWINQHV